MAITIVDGVVVEGPFTDKDQFERSGSVRDDVFSIVDESRSKQIQFDASSLSEETTMKLKGEDNSTLTLVTPGENGSYLGFREDGDGATEAYVGSNAGTIEILGSEGVKVSPDGDAAHSQVTVTTENGLILGREDATTPVILRASELKAAGAILSGGTTKATPGEVTAWLAVYSEGDDATFYIPMYSSQTS